MSGNYRNGIGEKEECDAAWRKLKKDAPPGANWKPSRQRRDKSENGESQEALELKHSTDRIKRKRERAGPQRIGRIAMDTTDQIKTDAIRCSLRKPPRDQQGSGRTQGHGQKAKRMENVAPFAWATQSSATLAWLTLSLCSSAWLLSKSLVLPARFFRHLVFQVWLGCGHLFQGLTPAESCVTLHCIFHHRLGLYFFPEPNVFDSLVHQLFSAHSWDDQLPDTYWGTFVPWSDCLISYVQPPEATTLMMLIDSVR